MRPVRGMTGGSRCRRRRNIHLDGPADFRDRYGYSTSPELLARVTKQQRLCLEPRSAQQLLLPPVEERRRAAEAARL